MELLTKERRRVWIPNHPTHGYHPGHVDDNADDGNFLLVVDEEGGKFQVPHAEALAVDPACLTGVDDLLTLGDFNEPALLHNIRVRYSEDKIYTGIGNPILISVNPYQHLAGLYSQERMREYKRYAAKAPGQSGGGLSVHLYSVADAAYRAMLQEQSNQSIIISGESGAGKTEATKRILAYLAELQTSRTETGPAKPRSVESQVLDANPVLEAFGNAKTVRNDNSSRFGKFVEVEFDSGGKLLSAQISNYLLEKCRIVTQQPEERNYHIFYQLCAGAGHCQDAPQGMKLLPAVEFEYVQVCDEIRGVDDVSEFKEVLSCMLSLGFSLEERDSALKAVAAVLHLGNLTFAASGTDGQDGIAVEDNSKVDLICELLGLGSQQLRNVFEHKTLEDPLTKKIIHMPHDVSSASFTRHSMAKVIYARLFDWLVWRINESMSNRAQQKDVRKIGLLDIYGFEVFEWNSFEQLCINFANEKLQQHFNTHMFTLEQRLYSSEGISWNHITWQDNQHIIDCLDKKPLGVFCLTDSECLMPAAKDATLFSKIENAFKNSKVIYKASRFATTDFAVAHYAGEVVYSVDTFLEKNTDKLHTDIVNLLKESKLELVRKIFSDPRFAPESSQKAAGAGAERTGRRVSRPNLANSSDQRRERQNVTVSMMFREQLDRLVEDLNKTNPRYVRCIKPNANKRPSELDSLDVLRQLRCAGMLESIRIRRAGYAVRRPFKEFFNRFRILAPHLAAAGPDPDYRSLCQRLLSEVEDRLKREGTALEEKSSQLGQTKVFMKEELERHMERLMVESAKRQVIMMQRCWRGFVQRRRFRMLRASALELQAALRTIHAVKEFQELKKRHSAAVQLQAVLRATALREAFTRQRRAAVSVQRFARGWRCRSRLGKLKSKAAAEKIRRMREEEERSAMLEKAREEARKKDAELEAMRLELEQTQRREPADVSTDSKAAARVQQRSPSPEERIAAAFGISAPAKPAETDEALQLREENSRLLAQLQSSEQARGNLEATARDFQVQLGESQKQQEELQQALQNQQAEAERAQREMREEQPDSSRAPQLSMLDTSLRSAALNLGGSASGQALDSLRSELLERLGEGGRGGNAVDPGHPLSTSLRHVLGDGSFGAANDDKGLEDLQQEPPMRKTIMNQRKIFEQLKQQFSEATKGIEDTGVEDEHPTGFGGEQKQLEDETRRLRKQNSALETAYNSAQEEATDRAAEASALMQQVAELKAELEDVRYRHKGEVQAQRQELQETLTALDQQTAELSRLKQHALEAEGRAARFETEAKQVENDCNAKQEQLDQLERSWQSLEHQNAMLRKERSENDGVLRQGESSFQQERERLENELRSREHELANLKQVLEGVMDAHAPVEELQRWKARAESLEHEYNKAMRHNREMSSAVGHMTNAASAQGGDLKSLQLRNHELLRDHQKKEQELKTVELEKQDLQVQMENVADSCKYFQNKYKVTAGELRNEQKELAKAVEGLAQAKAQISELSREHEVLRARSSKLSQQQTEFLGQSQEQVHRLQASEECLKKLVSVHTEELRAVETALRSSRDISSQDLQETLQAWREKARSTAGRLKSLLSAASETARGKRPASSGESRTDNGGYPAKSPAADASQRQPHPAQAHPQPLEGRASLLSQLNISQFKS